MTNIKDEKGRPPGAATHRLGEAEESLVRTGVTPHSGGETSGTAGAYTVSSKAPRASGSHLLKKAASVTEYEVQKLL